MDKSSALVWKTARRQFEGLPACPADLTEQEYTDFAFSARCDVRTNSSERLTWREMSTGLWKICQYRFLGNAA